ncbi:MAG: hypothetical protein ACI8XB_003327, partial [Patiriisocius sp.]
MKPTYILIKNPTLSQAHLVGFRYAFMFFLLRYFLRIPP